MMLMARHASFQQKTYALAARRSRRQGIFAFPRVVIHVVITRGDGLVTTAQAAAMVRRDPATIRTWVRRGRLFRAGLDERHNSLFDPADVIAAERMVRENGLRTSGVDPRPSLAA